VAQVDQASCCGTPHNCSSQTATTIRLCVSMANALIAFTFALTCTCAFGSCSEEGCIAQSMEEDNGLSLLQASARVVHGARLTANSTSSSSSMGNSTILEKPVPEVAYLDMMRHGEKCAKDGPWNMSHVGNARSAYLARCMSKKAPSAALPFGQPDVVMVLGGRSLDNKPIATVQPLANKVGIDLALGPREFCEGVPANETLWYNNEPVWKLYLKCIMAQLNEKLTNKGTIVSVGTYQLIPMLAQWMGLEKKYNEWPYSCGSFKEPACCAGDPNPWHGWDKKKVPYQPVSICFDAIWQVKFTRSSPDSLWQPESIKQLSEGWEGSVDDPCGGDLKAVSDSNIKAAPTHHRSSAFQMASGLALFLPLVIMY